MYHDHATPFADGVDVNRLMTSAAAGDDEAWAQLVQRYGTRIRNVARANRLRAQDAEDVVQTTWLELVKHIGRVRDPSKVGGWLHTTAQRESVRVAVAARRELPVDHDTLEPLPVPAVDTRRLEAAERRIALSGALGRLSDRQQTLMGMLLDDAGPSYTQISATLDMPIGSIGPTRARCIERLRTDEVLASAFADDLG